MQPPNDSQRDRIQRAFSDAEAIAASGAQTQRIHPQDLATGTVIGKCAVVRELGRGGMGAVYLGRHLTLDVPVAIKVLPAEVARRSPDYAERFLREARLAAKLRHPNVLAIMDADKDAASGLYYMITEFMDGGSVGDRMAKGPLSEKQAAVVTAGVAKALQMAEKQGIVHRDIKPGNILYSKDGRVKLADLGLAKLQGSSDITKSSSAIGTPYYMSPEQIEDSKRVDIRSDIYSLGATYFHMLTGQPPYPGNDVYNVLHKAMTAPVPDPRELRADLSESAAGIVMRMLAKDVAKRYQSPSAVLSDLLKGQVSAPEGVAAPPAPLELEPAGGSSGGARPGSGVAVSGLPEPPMLATAPGRGRGRQVDPAGRGRLMTRYPWLAWMTVVFMAIAVALVSRYAEWKEAKMSASHSSAGSGEQEAAGRAARSTPGPDSPDTAQQPPDEPPTVPPPSPPTVGTSRPVDPPPVVPKRPLSDGALVALTFETATLSARGNLSVIEDGTGRVGVGTLHGGPQPSEGRIGLGLAFDGANDHIEFPALAERTVSVWVQPAAPLQTGWYDGGGSETPLRAFQVGLFQPGGFKDGLVRTYGVFLGTWHQDVAVPFDELRHGWHHVVVSWDGGRVVRILIDGRAPDGHIVLAEGPWDPSPSAQPFALPHLPAPDAEAPTWIGRLRAPWWRTGQAYFRGLMDEVAIWERSMTLEEMQELWALSSAGTSYCETIRREIEAARREAEPLTPPPPEHVADSPPAAPVTEPPDPTAVPPKPEASIADGCVAAFTFENSDTRMERQNPFLVDVSGTGNHAPLGDSASPTFVKGRVNQGVRLTGSSRLVLPALTVRSVAAWVFLEKQEAGLLFAAGTTGEYGRSFLVAFHERSTWDHWKQGEAGISLGFWMLDAIAPAPRLARSWHHIVASWDGERTVRLAIDGKILPGSTAQRNTVRAAPGPHPLPETPSVDDSLTVSIGRFRPGDKMDGSTGFPGGFRGIVDDFAIWDRALTADEIAALPRFAARNESYCDTIRKLRKR